MSPVEYDDSIQETERQMVSMRRCVTWLTVILMLSLALAASTMADFGSTEMTEPVDVRLVADSGFCLPAVGETVVVDVMVYGVEDLNGTQFELSYDPEVLEIVDANPSLPGAQLGAGSLFAQWQMSAMSSVDEDEGTIEYYAFITGGASTAARGTGSMAQITFTVLQAKDARLEFSEDDSACLLPRDPDVVPPLAPAIEAVWYNGHFTPDCRALFLPKVSGR